MPSPPLELSTRAAMLTHQQHRTDGPRGGPITGGQVVPSHWRNTPQGGPMPLAGDTERQASRATNRHEPSGADRTSRAARAADAEPRKCIGSTRLSACTPSAAQPGPTGDADRRMRPARSPHQGQPSLLSVRRSERAAATATHTARRSPLVDQQLRLTRPAQVSQPKGARLVAEVPSRNEKLSAERPLLAQSAKRPGALAPRTSDLRET